MALCAGSNKKEKAAAFIKWAASIDGQRILAQGGFFPNQSALVGDITLQGNVAPGNVKAFSEALDFQKPGDWWYMPDVAWVQEWCVDLNSYVRNGKMGFGDWYKDAIKDTNASLKLYK
jgi:ABC-type glycerol-3-phosphate transport system substrate-binding protein